MTDFYALLKQSILDRGIRDAGDREGVYAQARRAVVKQLWDFRPPLAADEIDMRVGAYDTAVERIEADLKVVFANGEAKPKATAQPRVARRSEAATPVRTASYAANGHGQSAALAEWAREQPEYAPGVQRSAAATAPVPQETPTEEYDEQPLVYDDEEDETPQEPRDRQRADRWSERTARDEPRQPLIPAGWLSWLGTGDQIKVRLLAIAIGALFVVLVGVGAYLLGARNNQGVTLAIGVRREVSDAATAARIPNDKLQVTQSFAVFDGRDPTIFSTTPDNPIRFDSTNGFARVSSSTGAPGVKVLIGPGLATRLAGQQVRIVLVARSSAENGAANMRFAYQSGLAISHWQTANLSQDYKQLGILWRVPTMRTSPTGDYLLVEPGIPGDGTGVDIQSIRIDVLAS